MNQEQMTKLRYFFLKSLPNYFSEIIKDVISEKDQEEYHEKLRQRYKLIVNRSERGFCRSISQVVSICLERYGFHNEMSDIQIILGNKVSKRIFEVDGIEGVSREVKRGNKKLYTLGCGFSNYADDFHTVILINNTILDMTANQMKRINKGIIINNYWDSLENLKKKYKCILIYNVLRNKPHVQSAILDHPRILEIMNYTSKQISLTLNIPNIVYYDINVNYKAS
jgi:F0F1-type ATP synthase gamma subunit